MNEVAEPSAVLVPPEAVAVEAPLARLYGQPVHALPRDLYIPPDALELVLEAFEGPLDLLLYLIRKQGFNILDIPMSELTRQYLLYVDEIRTRNLELAAEYLLMAAMLIEIKSRMLLPVTKADDEGEPEDPRAELVRRLLEYEKIKLGAQNLDRQPLIERDFWAAQVAVEQVSVRLLPEVSADELRVAWLDVVRRAKLKTHHKLGRAELSVREHMSIVLRRLSGQKFVEFQQLFTDLALPVVVVHFLALLELAREGLVDITQGAAYAPIYVRLSYTPTAA